MAGHSKWANIQHRKNRQDAKRGQLWTKLIREITVAARDGGVDPSTNPRLRLALEKASSGNIPKDTVNKAIQRGGGRLDGVNYEEVRYEGYGPGGAALIVDCLTDNRTRTVAEVRHALSKFGGNLGTDGSVAYQFRHCGQFVFAPGTPEDRVIEIGLDSGADDVQSAPDGSIEAICAPGDFDRLKTGFAKAGLRPELADITMKTLNEVALGAEDSDKMRRLVEAMEDLDDVQHVYTSASIDG
jgi:YebC/PmpR family DNA-binding regulatory protein